jgi:hypothetical protein
VHGLPIFNGLTARHASARGALNFDVCATEPSRPRFSRSSHFTGRNDRRAISWSPASLQTTTMTIEVSKDE